MEGRHFARTSWDWLTPFSVVTGIALMFGYSLLGAGWLIIKTDGNVQAWASRMSRRCLFGVLAAIALISIWTPMMDSRVAAHWFLFPDAQVFAPLPLLTLLAGFGG